MVLRARVDFEEPGAVDYRLVRSGDPLRGMMWTSFARALNYANGTWRTLIPWCSPNVEIHASAPARALTFKAFPSLQTSHRMWRLAFGSTVEDETMHGSVTFTDPSGGTSTFTPTSVGEYSYHDHVEAVAVRTSAETTLAPTLEGDGYAGLIGLACYEGPRRELVVDAIDGGLSLFSMMGGAPILGGVTGHSLGAIPDAVARALARNRRTMLQWAVFNEAPWDTTSASYVDTPVAGLEVLERHLYAGDGSGAAAAAVRALAWVSGGTGDLEIATAVGTETIAISATSPTWVSGTLPIDTEDMTTAYGRRSAAQVLTVQARKNGGGTLYLAGISVHGRTT